MDKILNRYIKYHLKIQKACLKECDGKNEDCEKCLIITRHRELRKKLKEELSIREEVNSSGDEDIYSFLTGSYKRGTLIRPPKDVDFFIVLKEDDYKDFKPAELLNLLYAVLEDIFDGEEIEIKVQTHSITVKYADDFGIDIILAFEDGDKYRIPHVPEKGEDTWLITNPKKHEEKLQAVNEKTDGKIRRLAKLVKSWRREKIKPLSIEISAFHLEMIAMEIFENNELADMPTGMLKYFENAITYLEEECIVDPGNPEVNIDTDVTKGDRVRIIANIEKEIATIKSAIQLEKDGKKEEALAKWNTVFSKDDTPLDYYKSVPQEKALTYSENIFPKAFSIKARLWNFTMKKYKEVYRSNGRLLPKQMWLQFTITNPYPTTTIVWQVVNQGKEATDAWDLRGEPITHGKTYINEHTQYKGTHFINCFLVLKNQIIAKDRFYVSVN